METLAALLLAAFVAGYFVLAGADVGLGMLLPLLGRGRAERGSVLAAGIGPLFFANEVWLVAAAGVFAGCFPALEGELFGRLLPVLVPLLAGWLLRDAGLWWRRVSAAPVLDGLVVAGSWLLAGSWGWLLASLLVGGERPGPAPVVTGALTAAVVALLFLAHGLSLSTRRLVGEPLRRARQLTGGRTDGATRLLTSVVMAALPVLAGARLPLTEHAAGDTTLLFQLPLLCAALPLLLAAQWWLRRTASTTPHHNHPRGT
ncbi:cytochrome d ubiquinol oxidase subunit II [Streptomyces millisiae]|uniref:Cytochrome d ubiquinol oxidase subunit II n=1 Tax=Streptomyces millisiae TaxID=3075542 RepID=A0ABU2LX07_9ACTN|nr:cytochrome d ubiquinol oxidase subunit II [Streptomyces sp. DSM 44918]MDT0322134.1 cytochrome d ubiquinol oxidase subunit II [Streptomyces sp. DSM 44918]